MINKFNLATPGRGAGKLADEQDQGKNEFVDPNKLSIKAQNIVKGFGG